MPPAVSSDAWYQANRSNLEWEVYLEGKTPCASQMANRATLVSAPQEIRIPFAIDLKFSSSRVRVQPGQTLSPNVARKVADGYLIGFNNGEFGGGLYWFSADGKQHYEIPASARFTENTQYLLMRGPELLSLRGLAHMSIHTGVLSRLAQDAMGTWKETPLVNLEDTASCYCFQGPDLWIATHSRLLRISARNQLTVAVDKAFWSVLYPNSLIASAPDTFYLGMRAGVARIQLRPGSTPDIRWLLPGDS